MKNRIPFAALCMAGVFVVTGPALAEKPSWAGGGKPDKKNERIKERHDDRRAAGDSHFNDDTRRILGDYYGQQAHAGKCPPGLAKKNNGCLPPGQAKKWAKGRPLPADLRYYDLPRDLLMRLPPPPPRHRYVQVAGDVLMIAVGTSMVVDAVEDILR
jgi:Ni/Co efflux regulator RcnB